MWNRRWMWVLWPAFLVAGVIEMLVFALVDPQELQWAGQALALSNQGVYTIAFLIFWALVSAACALTALLSVTPGEVNHLPGEGVDAQQAQR